MRVRLPVVAFCGHTAVMAVTYAVIGHSESEVRTALRQLCELFGLESLGAPSQLPGQEKWLGRATPPAAVITSDRI